MDLGADFAAVERHRDLVRDGENVGGDADGVGFLDDHGTRAGLTSGHNRDLNLDLFAAVDGQQVGVVDLQAEYVLVNGFDHGQLLAAINVNTNHGVQAVVTNDSGEFQALDVDVLRLETGAVDYNRDQASAAGAAGGTFAEFCAGGCG